MNKMIYYIIFTSLTLISLIEANEESNKERAFLLESKYHPGLYLSIYMHKDDCNGTLWSPSAFWGGKNCQLRWFNIIWKKDGKFISLDEEINSLKETVRSQSERIKHLESMLAY